MNAAGRTSCGSSVASVTAAGVFGHLPRPFVGVLIE